MSDRLPTIAGADMDEAQRALAEAIVASRANLAGGGAVPDFVRADGGLDGPFGIFLHHPPLGDALQRVGAALRTQGVLTPRQREAATLVVAAVTGCAYEWAVHARAALAVGLDPDQLADLRTGVVPSGFDGTDVLVLELTRSFLEDRVPDDAAFRQAGDALGVPALVELAALVGYYRTLALQMALFDVTPPTRAVTGLRPPAGPPAP